MEGKMVYVRGVMHSSVDTHELIYICEGVLCEGSM